jgi:hypothetical protein
LRDPSTPQAAYRALQRRARDERRGTQELFEFYLLERFLYRLSISRYRERFMLKGGLLLTILGAPRTPKTIALPNRCGLLYYKVIIITVYLQGHGIQAGSLVVCGGKWRGVGPGRHS